MAAVSTKSSDKTSGIGDDAVRAKTGKTWAQWGAILDRAGCKDMTHKEIAAWVLERYPDIGGWWAQSVTVGYEQSRGMRVKHEKVGGFEVAVSKTVNVPIEALYRAWKNDRSRQRWLPEAIVMRKATVNKSMRITWTPDETHLNVYFYDKGSGKSQVSVQHIKLKSAQDAERRKKYWRGVLGEMKGLLEGK